MGEQTQGADARAQRDAFRVDLNGLTLSDHERSRLATAIQSAALRELAEFDSRGDFVALAFPRHGSTQGIQIVASGILDRQVPELRERLGSLDPSE